ncbi:MAG TPA: beta-L-arabinofuranosidase domain-containing protein [Candidatus Dormibacteraeota bacterium]
MTAVVDTSRSPRAALRPVPIRAVRMRDGFWERRRQLNRTVSLPEQHRMLEETGRFHNLRVAAGLERGSNTGKIFNDSDVHKWMEAACWQLATDNDPWLAERIDAILDLLEQAQEPDGYLFSPFVRGLRGQRWSDGEAHELYCAGHLFQAAVAHHRVTGSDRALQMSRRFADLICATFGEGRGKLDRPDGHPMVEMALVELYRETGEPRYLEQASFLIDARGHKRLGEPYAGWTSADYNQDHRPVRERERPEGHAVRDLYLMSGVTDRLLEAADPDLEAAVLRIWESLARGQVYVTGAVGVRDVSEAFGRDYELPNETAYAETCAAVALMMWNWRLLQLTGDARYADLFETGLYNGMLSGVSLDGREYFYANPLACNGGLRRRPWYLVACCPPNVARTLAALPGYLFGSGDGIWIHQYASCGVAVDGVALAVSTELPWTGEVAVEVRSAGRFPLRLRIPGWAQGTRLSLNGQEPDVAAEPGAYALLDREWQPGDVVALSMPTPVRRLASHPGLLENTGRVALARGPLVYCVEQGDVGGADPRWVSLPAESEVRARVRSDLLGGVTVLEAAGRSAPPEPAWDGRLYREAGSGVEAGGEPLELTAIPYFAWANRDAGRMQVWLREDR